MTSEEYTQGLAKLEKEMFQIQLQERDKRGEIHKHKTSFCQSLCEQYAAYQGKKVRIRFSCIDWNKKIHHYDVIGYLRGFSFGHYYSPDEIYPEISKCKKDGSESKNRYSTGDVSPWNCIVEIEEVKD